MDLNIENRSELCKQCENYPDRWSIKSRCKDCVRNELLKDSFIPQPVFSDDEAQFLRYAARLGFEYINFLDSSIMLWHIHEEKLNGIRKDLGEIDIDRNITRLIESGQLKPVIKHRKDEENGNEDC